MNKREKEQFEKDRICPTCGQKARAFNTTENLYVCKYGHKWKPPSGETDNQPQDRG